MKYLGIGLTIIGISVFLYTFMICLNIQGWGCRYSIPFNFGGVVGFIALDLAIIGGIVLFEKFLED